MAKYPINGVVLRFVGCNAIAEIISSCYDVLFQCDSAFQASLENLYNDEPS